MKNNESLTFESNEIKQIKRKGKTKTSSPSGDLSRADPLSSIGVSKEKSANATENESIKKHKKSKINSTQLSPRLNKPLLVDLSVIKKSIVEKSETNQVDTFRDKSTQEKLESIHKARKLSSANTTNDNKKLIDKMIKFSKHGS